MNNISTEIFDIAKFLYENEECEVIVNRYGQVEDVSFDNVDYEDFCAYAMDCSEEDFEKAEIYLKSLLMNDVKFYSEYSRYLELSDNRTLNDITVPEGVNFDIEEYSVVRDMAVNQLSQEIHTEVYMLGRSGRHICVDNTFNNLVHYSEYKQKQKEWEAWLINVVNQELTNTPKDDLSESLNAGEYVAKCLNCGADVVYTKRDVCEDIDGDYIECPNCKATFDVDVLDSLHNKKEEAIDWVGDTKVNDNGTVTIDGRERTVDSIKAEIKSLRDELKRSKEAYSNKQISKHQRSYDKFRYTRQIEKLKAFLDLLNTNSTDLEEDCTQASGVDAGKVTLFGSDGKDKKEELITEDINTAQTITEKLNTGVLPIVDTDMYSLNDVLPESATLEELDDIVKEVATPFIKDTIQKVLPSVEIKATGVYHPKQYNFSGDELEFDLTVSSEEYEALKEKVLADNKFNKFLSDEYSSKSGIISTMPDSIEEFNVADSWKQLVQVIMFALRNEALTDVNEAYLNDFLDAVSNEFPSDDIVEEDKGLGLSESELKENLNK